nr:MAG TPA: hypothetical protein [Caudoviricetes sp.]
MRRPPRARSPRSDTRIRGRASSSPALARCCTRKAI